ncbi:MAG: RnfABCDGE type electron transport complex subunit G [bacterium]
MKVIFKYGIILSITGIIASGSLAWINQITQSKIIMQEHNKFDQGLYQVLPGTEKGIIIPVYLDSKIIAYQGFSNPDTTDPIGYAFPADGIGYSGIIKTLAAIDTSGTVLAIKVLSQTETPGLGSKCEEIRAGESSPWCQEQFKGKKATDLAVDKDDGNIDSISGATITSRAITNAVADSARSLLRKLDTLKAEE